MGEHRHFSLVSSNRRGEPRDGKRFLMLKGAVDSNAAGGEPTGPHITIVLNWTEELKRLVPVK